MRVPLTVKDKSDDRQQGLLEVGVRAEQVPRRLVAGFRGPALPFEPPVGGLAAGGFAVLRVDVRESVLSNPVPESAEGRHILEE